MDYVLDKLVEAGSIEKANDFLYSSVIYYLTNQKGVLEIKFLFKYLANDE